MRSILTRRRWKRLFPLLSFFAGVFVHYLATVIFSRDESSVVVTVVTESPAFLEEKNQFLVVLVFSSVTHQERRQTVRDTWASELDADDVALYFVISGGKMTPEESAHIAKEEKYFNDLLILHGVEDSYDTLTLKMLVALLWLSGDSSQLGAVSETTLNKPFQTFSFVLKCDDDSYVRVNDIITELLTKYVNNKMLYWGFFDGKARVKKTGKYKELNWNICDTYLPYALGGGYILGPEPVLFITRNAKYWRLYRNEDTAIGAWLANMEGVEREHDPRFDTEYLSRGCHQSYLITHKHTMEGTSRMHHHFIATGKFCRKEYRTRLSYRYDWNLAPSKCCLRNNPNIP